MTSTIEPILLGPSTLALPSKPQLEQDESMSLQLSIPAPSERPVTEDGSSSDDSVCRDQDEAQAVLQPAISALARTYTSPTTPAVEKTAAMSRFSGAGFFEHDERERDSDDDAGSSPGSRSSPVRTPRMKQDASFSSSSASGPAPPTLHPSAPSDPVVHSSWQAPPRETEAKDVRSRPSRSMLRSAFGANRERRSGSAGQETLKKLSKALPSFNHRSSVLSSLPGSLFSSFTDKSDPAVPSEDTSKDTPSTGTSTTSLSRSQEPFPDAPVGMPVEKSAGASRPSSTSEPPRPILLRRATSDESILYHTVSRTSSLGDDAQFNHVREMVNMRLVALKDSLPEVPNLRVPGLSKLQAASRRSSVSNMNKSTEALGTTPVLERESSSFRDPTTVLDEVLESLTGDVVIMGGYRGSELRTATAPHQQLWAPVRVGLNLRKANLELGLNPEDEEVSEESIISSGMLKHIGPIDVSRRLFKKLRSCENARNGTLRVWDYGYDWRLSPHVLSRKLEQFLEGLPCNQPGVAPESRGALVIPHSLGGVITRHTVNQRPELFSGVLYTGVPQRCINILGPFRNGDVILFNENLLTAAVNFSVRTSFVFLPEDGFCFVDKNTHESYPVDFYDPQEWIKWHLSPCVQPALPPLNAPPPTSSLASLLPNALRSRSNSRTKSAPDPSTQKDRAVAPQMNTGAAPPVTNGAPITSDEDRQRYFEYLTRVLADTKRFRSELAHSPAHQEANVYPPLAVLYGKTTPTVYAVQVNGREGIPCSDAYDDLLFRPGDGVVLAKEAMLPEGYSVVRGGRISTEKGHIGMLGDLAAVGQALKALVRGRRKGIGMGKGESPSQ